MGRYAVTTLPHAGCRTACVPIALWTSPDDSIAASTGADPEERIKQMAAAAPSGRLGDPAEFGAACAFLCSRQAGYISGQTLGVDGGTLIGVH